MDNSKPILTQADLAYRLAVSKNNGADSLASRDICLVCFGHQVYKAGPDGEPIPVKCPGCGGGKSE